MNTDRIEKTIVLRASRSAVWRALTNADEFGAWFGAKMSGSFAPGARVTGRITTPGYDHLTMDLVIDRVEPERVFAYRWHPFAIDAAVDYSAEPMTVCEFTRDDAPDGTRLTIVESGFDGIPPARRDLAFRMNEGGWTAQMENIQSHLAGGGVRWRRGLTPKFTKWWIGDRPRHPPPTEIPRESSGRAAGVCPCHTIW